jgi:hypothetical protein
VTLTWTASSDDTAVAGYRVYRGSKLIATTPATTYTDTLSAKVGSASYSVAAVDGARNVSDRSATVSVTP